MHLADQLRYRGHEAIPVGAAKTSDETRTMLARWADVVIFTDSDQQNLFPHAAETRVWPIADAYPRPYNAQLLAIVRQHLDRSDL